MSIKDKLQNSKSSFLFWFIVLAVAVFSFSAGYLISLETNPAPIVIECEREV